MLVGGDEFREECTSMDSYLLERINKANPRVAIIPTAAANQQPQKAATNGITYFNALGANAESIMILSREDAENNSYFENIAEMDLIYFTGGDPKHLFTSLNQTMFMEYVVSLVSNGTFLVGSSAGAMVLGSKMRYENWIPGMGFVSNTAVMPHHEKSVPENIFLEIHTELSTGTNVIGIDSATGVFFHEGEVKILGKGKAVFYSEDEYKIIRAIS